MNRQLDSLRSSSKPVRWTNLVGHRPIACAIRVLIAAPFLWLRELEG